MHFARSIILVAGLAVAATATTSTTTTSVEPTTSQAAAVKSGLASFN